MFAVLGFIIGLVVVSGALFLVGATVFGRGETLAPAPRDSTPVVLPGDRPPDAADIEALRFSVVLRGYRMLEVDWVLDQLSEGLREKDRQIAALTNQLTRQPAAQPLVSTDAPITAHPAHTADTVDTVDPVSSTPVDASPPPSASEISDAGVRDA